MKHDITLSVETAINGGGHSKHIDVLDVWRAVACLMVFTFHTGLFLRTVPFAIVGSTGVHLFFVLSGYLIAKPFLSALLDGRGLPSIWRFYMRRCLRIYPPYAVALLVFVVLRYATRTNPPTAWEILLRVLLVFNYFPQTNFFGINGVFWSLAIEAQFYVLLPLACAMCAIVLRRKGLLVASAPVVLFIVIGMTSRAFELLYSRESDIRFRFGTSYLDLFGWGMAIALLQKYLRGRLHRLAIFFVAWTGAGMFIAANDLLMLGHDWLTGPGYWYFIWFPMLVCVGASLMLLAALNSELDMRRTWLRVASWIGTISYSLYLYHSGVQFVFFKLVPLNFLSYNEMATLYSLMAIGPSLLVAWVMFRLVEYPSLRMAARFHDVARSLTAMPEAVAIAEAVSPAL